jgi:hypothetical protein
MTVTQLCTAALSRLGIPGVGQTPRQEDLDLAFDRLNQWIDALALESLTVSRLLRTTWTLTSATSYTIGTGATVNVARPVSPQAIKNCGYVDTSVTPNREYLFGPVLTEQAYQAIAQKTITATYPAQWYYDPSLTTGTLKPWPVPTGSSLQGVVYTESAVSEFSALSDTVSVAPGWKRFLINGLAVELAPEFGKELDPAIVMTAREAKSAIKRGNERLSDLTLDVALLVPNGRYDITVDG